MRLRTLEVTRAGLIGTVAVFLTAAVCVRLGFWQLERRDERMVRNAAIAERLAVDPVSLEAVPGDTAGLLYRRVRLAGAYDVERSVLLAGRSHMGSPGAHLVTPLRFGTRAILVNRGWLPTVDPQRVDTAAFTADSVVAIEGVVMPFPDVDVDASPEGFERVWYRFDGDAIRAHLPYSTAPIYVQRTRSSSDDATVTSPGTGSLPVPLDPPSLDQGPHLSYAIQWFSFALIVVVGWSALVLSRRGKGNGPPRAASVAAA